MVISLLFDVLGCGTQPITIDDVSLAKLLQQSQNVKEVYYEQITQETIKENPQNADVDRKTVTKTWMKNDKLREEIQVFENNVHRFDFGAIYDGEKGLIDKYYNDYQQSQLGAVAGGPMRIYQGFGLV